MKNAALISALLLTSSVAFGQTSPSYRWTGVWQGELDGVPSVTLTLAEDAGAIDGTIVFHAVSREGGKSHSISVEPHTLIHPHLEGEVLAFQVRRGNGSAEILDMTVELAGDKIEFRCSNCGEGTKAELIRMK